MALRINLPTSVLLTTEQKRVINSDYSACKAVMLTGCPGSGKTVASAYRVINRHKRKKQQTLVLTFHNLLAVAIRNTLRENGVDVDVVNTVMRWFYQETHQLLRPNGRRDDDHDDVGGWLDSNQISRAFRSVGKKYASCELFIDEGQDLPLSVFDAFPVLFERTFITADKAQRVHACGAAPESILPVIQRIGNVEEETLQLNYRNSFEVFNFARQFVPEDGRANNEFTLRELARRRGQSVANKPNVYLFDDLSGRDSEMKKLLANVLGVKHVRETVGILLSRSADVDAMYKAVLGWGYKVTKYHAGDECPDDAENCVVTTYKSAKGLEFNHVIIPQLNLGDMSKEQWFVACTRAINALQIFCRGGLPILLRNFSSETYKRVELS